MAAPALAHQRLRQQRLIQSPLTTPEEVVTWLGAVQADDDYRTDVSEAFLTIAMIRLMTKSFAQKRPVPAVVCSPVRLALFPVSMQDDVPNDFLVHHLSWR